MASSRQLFWLVDLPLDLYVFILSLVHPIHVYNGHLENREHVPGGVPVGELENLHSGDPQHHAALQPGTDHLANWKAIILRCPEGLFKIIYVPIVLIVMMLNWIPKKFCTKC